MNKKGIIKTIVILLSLCSSFFVFAESFEDKPTMKNSAEKKQFNLSEPENCVVEIDGKIYEFVIMKYNPPYISPSNLLKSKADENLLTPEGTNLAMWSSINRDKDWYLSLHDEGLQKYLIDTDQKSKGRLLEEANKDKPLRNPLKEGTYEEFLCKAELSFNNKEYAIIQSKRFKDGMGFPGPTFTVYVKQNNKWLRTDDLKNHPIKRLVGLKTFEEIKTICGTGRWAEE